MDTFSDRVLQARKAQKLTLAKLAEATNSSPSYLSKVEKGKIKEPSATMVIRIAKYFDWSIEEVLQMFQDPRETSLDKQIAELEEELTPHIGSDWFDALRKIPATLSDKRFFIDLMKATIVEL